MRPKKTILSGTKLTPMERKEIALVKRILSVISESKFAYDEKQEKIDFEVVFIGLSSTDIDDVITIFSAFRNLKETTKDAISLKDLTGFMDKCYTSLEKLKGVAEFGTLYHDIITRYYINKEFVNMDKAMDELNIGCKKTFVNRSREAMLQLFKIWLYADKGSYIEMLKMMLDAIEE